MKFEVLEATVPAISDLACAWPPRPICAGEVCQTTETVAVETMRPIQTSLTGSNSPGPPSTLPSVERVEKEAERGAVLRRDVGHVAGGLDAAAAEHALDHDLRIARECGG